MNVYDFDNTILRGDSTARFFAYCLFHYPKMWLDAPAQAWNGLLFLLKLRKKQAFKQRMLGFVRLIETEPALERFWAKNLRRVKRWYLEQQRPDDVVISASPAFILAPACEKLGIRHVIASPVDPRTGRFHGKNCHDVEKVARFRAVFPKTTVENFYSDSRSDDPMARQSEKAWLVKGERILPW